MDLEFAFLCEEVEDSEHEMRVINPGVCVLNTVTIPIKREVTLVVGARMNRSETWKQHQIDMSLIDHLGIRNKPFTHPFKPKFEGEMLLSSQIFTQSYALTIPFDGPGEHKIVISLAGQDVKVITLYVQEYPHAV